MAGFFGFNQDGSNPFFADRRVPKAMSLAFDTDRISCQHRHGRSSRVRIPDMADSSDQRWAEIGPRSEKPRLVATSELLRLVERWESQPHNLPRSDKTWVEEALVNIRLDHPSADDRR